ncbi:MAG: hypothetical protein AAFU41_00870 [Pseudomonadota bacterium]
MTNMADCIAGAVKQGQLDPARASEARRNFQQLAARYAEQMPRAQANAAAAADLKEATEAAGRQRFHKVVNQLQAMRRLKNAVETADDPALVLRDIIEFHQGSGYRGESVRYIREGYEAQINASIRDVLEGTGLNIVGSTRNRARLENMIRELHGEATGDATASKLATAVRRAQERMRRSFNAHGGDIGKLNDYGVMHTHDVVQLRKAGYEGWRDAIVNNLAWDRIVNQQTGKPFAIKPGVVPLPADYDRFLRDVYEGITTRGWDDRDPSLSVGGRAIYNQRAEHRVLHFKDGSSWLDYNRRFGTTDPFSAMINGLHGMARDVALMRVLGPNPRAGLQFAGQTATKRAAETAAAAKTTAQREAAAKLEARVSKWVTRSQTMLAHEMGDVNVPESTFWAAFFAGTRSVLTSIQLGSATLSSVTDLATMRMAAKVVGMNPGNVISKSVTLMADGASRETAARMGYVASSLADAGGGSSRFLGDTLGTGIPQRLAGFTLRASGLSWITDMRRVAFKMEFSGYMAENANRSFDKIDESLRQIFDDRGITAADWDALRDPAVRFTAPNGADFIAPSYWLEAQTAMSRAEAEGLAVRLEAIMSEQLEFAVPSASVEGRAMLQGTTAPGTVIGEVARSFTSYKSFALSLTLSQIRRWKALPGPMAKAQYAAEMSATMLILGALAIQLKELAKGNDPRPMDNWQFWGASQLQAGGLGIFGDFFASETSRIGGGLAETIAGPVVGAIGDVIGPIASNISRAASGDDLLIGRDIATTIRRNTPAASSLWYVRAAYDRIVADTIQRWLDPNAEELWRRQVRSRERDYGNASWWEAGDVLPQRAPDLSSIGGTQ